MFALGGADSLFTGQSGNSEGRDSRQQKEMLCAPGDLLSPCEVSGHGVNIIPVHNLLFHLVSLEQTLLKTWPVLCTFPHGPLLTGEFSTHTHTHIPSEFQ